MLLSNYEKIKDSILDASGLCLWEVFINLETFASELYVDDRLAEMYAISGKEMTGAECYAWWFGHMDDESRNSVNMILGKVFTSDSKDFELQYVWFHPVKPIYVRTGGRLVSMENGVAHILGYTQNISDQYQTMIMLEKQVLNFELAAEIGDYAVFDLEHIDDENDYSEVFIRTNNLFSSIFGMEERVTNVKEWRGLCRFFLPHQCSVWGSLVDHSTWVENTKVEFELPCLLENGTEKWLSLIYKVVRNSDAKLRVIGFIKDITASKNREVILEEASSTKSMFLANMSHEIRTPMNAVLNFAKFMLDTDLDDTQTNYVKKIISSGTHMLTIMNDILDFSKIEANKMTIEEAPYITVNESLFIRGLMESAAKDKNITLNVHRSENLPSAIVGDSMRIRQILVNLLSNAIKFTPEGGTVLFTASTLKKTENKIWLKFEISDTGIGMSESQLSNLFVAFSQADTSITRRFGGTGLGLTITERLVHLMGGEITVVSEVGKGSTFTAIIPFGIPTEEEMEALSKAPEKVIDHNVDIVGLTCLVAEDNVINQEVIGALFRTMSISYDVVNNGREAVDAFKMNREKYDCIFMDVQMPVMDGLTATREIRALDNEYAKTIPIFALTANAIRGEEKKSKDAGMNAHLTKPLSKKEILNTLVVNFPEKVIDKDILKS